MTAVSLAWKLASLAAALALVLIWFGVSSLHVISPAFLPSPERAFDALVRGFASGILAGRLLGTLGRMFYGWFLASLLGVVLGSLIGISERARVYLVPSLEMLRPLPASAVIPLMIAFFGFTDTMVLAAIGFGALWPTLLATVHGFVSLDPTLREFARTLAMRRPTFIRKVALPNAMPDIIAGMRISLVVALALTTVGEMMTSRDGLGYWILNAARTFRSADLFAGVILFAAIGYVSGQVLLFAERRLLAWQRLGR
jgi:sulfonate transport system permease protein